MKLCRFASVLLFLALLTGCGGQPAPVEDSPAPAGEIYLYGEVHGSTETMQYELDRWKECYAQGMRHLFVELPYYSAQYLNLWMAAEDDTILEQLYQDWTGTQIEGTWVREFYRAIKQDCPETVFHGTDIGHQYATTGSRYREYLEEQGQTDSEDYRLTQEAIVQGQTYYTSASDTYRENTMTDNFVQAFDALGGEAVMGIYGAAHADPDGLEHSSGGVPSMAGQLREIYGDALRTEDLSRIALDKEPLSVDSITVAGKTYEASYFGAVDISAWSDRWQSRAFWRLEDAYQDFQDCPTANNVLPYNNYPTWVEDGDVFVIDYTSPDGQVTREYHRADGTQWQGLPATTEFIPE